MKSLRTIAQDARGTVANGVIRDRYTLQDGSTKKATAGKEIILLEDMTSSTAQTLTTKETEPR